MRPNPASWTQVHPQTAVLFSVAAAAAAVVGAAAAAAASALRL